MNGKPFKTVIVPCSNTPNLIITTKHNFCCNFGIIFIFWFHELCQIIIPVSIICNLEPLSLQNIDHWKQLRGEKTNLLKFTKIRIRTFLFKNILWERLGQHYEKQKRGKLYTLYTLYKYNCSGCLAFKSQRVGYQSN